MTILIFPTVEQRLRLRRILHDLYEAGSDRTRTGDRGANHNRGGPQVQGTAYVPGVGDVTLYERRDGQVGDDGLDERPGDGAEVGGLGGVAVEGGGNGVGSGAFGSESIFEGGDVGENGAIELGVDAAD